MCAVCRARPARPAALTLRSRRRGCTSCGRTLRAFKRRARQTPRVAQLARARARAARRSSAPRRRARRGLGWHLSAGRRAHTRSARAQKLEELDDAMTEARARSRRGRASALNPETAPRAADDGRGRRRQASSRRRGAFRALRTPSLPSYPPGLRPRDPAARRLVVQPHDPRSLSSTRPRSLAPSSARRNKRRCKPRSRRRENSIQRDKRARERVTRACVAVAQVQKEAGTVGERQAALKKVRALGRRGPFRALSRNSDPAGALRALRDVDQPRGELEPGIRSPYVGRASQCAHLRPLSSKRRSLKGRVNSPIKRRPSAGIAAADGKAAASAVLCPLSVHFVACS